MKRIFLLAVLFLLPLIAFTQEVSSVDDKASLYNIDTAKKFKRIKEIVKDAKTCMQLTHHTNMQQGGFGYFYDIEKVKSDFANENLDSFLKDNNNRIVLAAVADYVMDTSYGSYHDNYELFITMGMDSVEAAVRTGEDKYIEEALNLETISYCHWGTHKSYGITSAECHVQSIEVQTSEQEIEGIKNQLENEKPLIDEFNKEMRKFRKQIRQENRKAFADKINKRMHNFLDKLEKQSYIRPSDTYMRWVGGKK